MDIQTEISAMREYPKTQKGDTTDTYFGQEVADVYRWLEDDRSQETEHWVSAQNKVTFDYLKKIPYREAIKQRLQDLWNYEKIGSPFKEGEYIYFYKNDGLQNQYVVWRQKPKSFWQLASIYRTFLKNKYSSLILAGIE